MDLTTYTVDDLDALRIEVAIEQERRARLANIPLQVGALAQRFTEDGGDPAVLRNILN